MSITQERRTNGVDTTTLFATIDTVRRHPELAQFRFRAVNDWVSGNHSEGRFPGFHGAGQDHVHRNDTVVHADHPAVLVGDDHGPTPGRAAAERAGGLPGRRAGQHRRGPGHRARQRALHPSRATSTCAGSSGSTTRSATASRTSGSPSRSTATGVPEQLAELVALSQARSAAFDVLSHGTAVTVGIVDGGAR